MPVPRHRLALLSTCRKTYEETHLFPFKLNGLRFRHAISFWNAKQFLQRLNRHQRGLVTRVQFGLQQVFTRDWRRQMSHPGYFVPTRHLEPLHWRIQTHITYTLHRLLPNLDSIEITIHETSSRYPALLRPALLQSGLQYWATGTFVNERFKVTILNCWCTSHPCYPSFETRFGMN